MSVRRWATGCTSHLSAARKGRTVMEKCKVVVVFLGSVERRCDKPALEGRNWCEVHRRVFEEKAYAPSVEIWDAVETARKVASDF